MNRDEVYDRLKDVFADVFDRDVPLSDATTAADVDGWDSMMHITLVGTIQDEFNVRFPLKDIVNAKTVGDIVSLILQLS